MYLVNINSSADHAMHPIRYICVGDCRNTFYDVSHCSVTWSCVFLIYVSYLLLKFSLAGIRWSSEAGMCMAETSSRYLGATWGAPIIFELHVIAVVVYNTIATPRSENVRLTQALQRDGLIFFIVVLLLRQLNLILAVAARPSLTMLSALYANSPHSRICLLTCIFKLRMGNSYNGHQ